MTEQTFPTLDRLMEFGLSMGLAQQMISMMNNTMKTMQIPETAQPIQPRVGEWYIVVDNKASGPFSETDIKKRLLSKELNKDSLVWCQGMSHWQSIEHTPAILKLFMQLPPAP